MANLSSEAQVGKRLEGKVALITGAAQGIGACMARVFVNHGAKVVCVDINEELGRSVCDDLGAENASFLYCDVTKESDIENAINRTVHEHGKLDIMINNAGIADEGKTSILDNDLSDFERVMRVNLSGVFLGIKHAARAMIPTRSGSIINLGSISGSIGGITSHSYSSSKHAVVGLTRNAAAELGKHGIRVNCLSSHVVLTPLSQNFFNFGEEGQSRVYTNLEGMVLKPEDLANAAVYLASEEARFMSGHNLMLDGGFTVTNPAFGLFSRF
ncbi:borneol dehydrogenase, mitochondrial-like [Coffea arabica]|uniref:Borneol dehydrogenase, mitochondrial-like n=1 Tax=Coffea arabica TaxID=13443 RepID=A0A6P6SHJ6_COFAR|nr:secoisolariciresinol dehydrogenase-like [Coffea arabica]